MSVLDQRQAAEQSTRTSSHSSVHWALPDAPWPITNEERMGYIIQEGKENSIQWAICHMSCNAWPCPGEKQTSAEEVEVIFSQCRFLEMTYSRPSRWVKATLSFSCVPFTLHGSLAFCTYLQECLCVVCWLLKCWEIYAELSEAKKLHCQALRFCYALYCDVPLKLHKPAAAERFLKTLAHRSHSTSALPPALADSRSAACFYCEQLDQNRKSAMMLCELAV